MLSVLVCSLVCGGCFLMKGTPGKPDSHMLERNERGGFTLEIFGCHLSDAFSIDRPNV